MKRLLGFVLCVVLLASWTSTATAEEGRPLRIVAYNGEHLVAPGERARFQKYRWNVAREDQFERIAAVIETLHPDILAIMEVNSAKAVVTLIDILHEKGLTDYAGYHAESNDGFTGMDVAIISKFKPDEIDGKLARAMFSKADDNQWREEFTYDDDGGTTRSRETTLDRNVLCYFTIDGRKLAVLGLHLKSNPDDNYSNGKRTAEAKIVQRIIRQEILPRGYEPIVLGDWEYVQLDMTGLPDDDGFSTESRRTVYDYVNNDMYFYDFDNDIDPIGGGSFVFEAPHTGERLRVDGRGAHRGIVEHRHPVFVECLLHEIGPVRHQRRDAEVDRPAAQRLVQVEPVRHHVQREARRDPVEAMKHGRQQRLAFIVVRRDGKASLRLGRVEFRHLGHRLHAGEQPSRGLDQRLGTRGRHDAAPRAHEERIAQNTA